MRKLFECCKCPEWLIKRMAPPTYQDIKLAIWHQQIDKINCLLQQGAPKYQEGQTILHFAIINDKVQAVQYISNNCKQLLQERNQNGDTPFLLAIFCGNMKIIKQLHSLSKLNAKDNYGNTALIISSANNNIQLVKLLLMNEINPTIKNFEGQTALHRACYYGNIQVIKVLIERTQLKFCQIDKNNNNCLHLASQGCSIICMKYIINKVEDPQILLNHKNNEGKMPLDVLEDMVNKLNTLKRSNKKGLDFQGMYKYVMEDRTI